MVCDLPKHSISDIHATGREYELRVACDCGEEKYMVEWHVFVPVGWDEVQWRRMRKVIFLAFNGNF